MFMTITTVLNLRKKNKLILVQYYCLRTLSILAKGLKQSNLLNKTMLYVYKKLRPTIKMTRSLHIINVTTTLKFKCHNHNGYCVLYKQAEQFLVSLGKFLVRPELDCYIVMQQLEIYCTLRCTIYLKLAIHQLFQFNTISKCTFNGNGVKLKQAQKWKMLLNY